MPSFSARRVVAKVLVSSVRHLSPTVANLVVFVRDSQDAKVRAERLVQPIDLHSHGLVWLATVDS